VSDIIFQKEYKKSPSLKQDLLVLLFWLIVLSLLIVIGATKGFESEFNLEFFSDRMAPIYSLFGTICLAYELFTAIRNESNKNRLNQQLIKAMEHRESVALAFVVESDKDKRIKELNEQIQHFRSDLEHEMLFVRRRYYIGWLGIALTVLSTFLQLPRV
jgi:hypothetical protein